MQAGRFHASWYFDLLRSYRKGLLQLLKGSENPQTRYFSWPFTSGRVKVTLSESVKGS